MRHISWDKLFAGEVPGKGASEAELQAFEAALGKPLSEEEIQEANSPQEDASSGAGPQKARTRPIDPRRWHLPAGPLPPAYLSFLKWSNGGSFYNGDRGFNLMSTSTLRAFALSYGFPEHMPGALPFAFDGGDNFYVFDMRSGPVGGEYPILFVHGDKQSYADAVPVARSFVEACEGQTDPAALFKD
jgi:hypothetical protein